MSTSSDRLLRAALTGTATHCVDVLLPDDEAIAAIHEVTTSPRLLAETAGQIAGSAQPEWRDWPLRQAQARLLVAAGADRALLRAAVESGRTRLREPIPEGSPVPASVDGVVAEILWPPE